ncbi:amidohydrolase [uncultured Vagococcus sp.]|uniref:amidohydrolase n=1 Tax=uncultured Vagococcus sp. TaxID=189676 RepID=UPI0028D872CB|nr:amidohydrolase [uncultured Vagococcus sp.]
MTKEIKTLIEAEEEKLITMRRYLHQHPELSMEEFETTKWIAKELDELAISYKLGNPTGLIATIKGSHPGKMVLLRADMDALPVRELNEGLSYSSQNEGKSHACGHDAHTAMLLTAARVLVQLKEKIHGSIRLIFQPAEEVAKGAKLMIEQGALESVDNVFGIHIWSGVPVGQVCCYPGPSFAAADIVKIHFEGVGGHAAMPEQTVDAAIVASQFVSTVQTIVSREIDPLHPAVVTIGKMDVGQRFNVIAQDAYLEGTIRNFNEGTRGIVEEKISHYAQQLAGLYGAKASVDYVRMTEVVDNDYESAQLVTEITQDYFGKEAIGGPAPTMGAEDFGFYMRDRPGAFALVGSGNPDKDSCWPHHHGRFNIDEDALKMGAELYTRYALAYLNKEM